MYIFNSKSQLNQKGHPYKKKSDYVLNRWQAMPLTDNLRVSGHEMLSQQKAGERGLAAVEGALDAVVGGLVTDHDLLPFPQGHDCAVGGCIVGYPATQANICERGRVLTDGSVEQVC